MTEFLKIAELDDKSVHKIKGLEKEMGVHIMAFESGLDLADLSKEQLNRVQALEDALGVTLIVYKS